MPSSISELQHLGSTSDLTLRSTSAAQHRFHILDALRGIAAIFVVWWHVPSYLAARGTQSSFLAVDFFFCLSGFVIAFSYERRLATSMGLAKFTLARLIRLYPVYLLGCILGAFIFLCRAVDWPLSTRLLSKLILMITLQFAMLPNLGAWDSRLLFPLNFPSWSMFFEVLANIGYAALLRKAIATSGVLIVIALLSLATLIFLARTQSTIDLGWVTGTANVLGGTARVALSFTAGVLVLRIYRSVPRPTLSPTTSGLIALAVSAVLSLLLLTPLAIMRNKPFELLSVVALFPALVYIGSLCKAPSSWTRICAFLGDISYPMYLLHHFSFTILAAFPFEMRILKMHPRAHVAVAPTILLATAATSFVAVKYYDAPVRAFLTRRFNPRPALKSEPAPND